MKAEVLSAIFLPFLGTIIGSAFVFFLKGQMSRVLQRSLTGFAAGVMVAASFWILAANAVVPVMPYLLAFAAGAMMYGCSIALLLDISNLFGRRVAHCFWRTAKGSYKGLFSGKIGRPASLRNHRRSIE